MLLISITSVSAQSIPAERLTDWSKAGVTDSISDYGTVVNIMDYGAVPDGLTANDTAFASALAALAGKPGIILFPAGSYLFHQNINLRDSLVLRGNGVATKLLFNLGGSSVNAINIQGMQGSADWSIQQAANKNDTTLYLDNISGLASGDWIKLYGNDSGLVTSSWAYHSVGQILQIAAIQGNKVIFHQKLRKNYPDGYKTQLKKLLPVKNAGIECLYIERMDSTAQQTSNVLLNYAVDCHIIGIESNQTNFAHIEVDNSAHLTIRGNYFHHSHAYGSNGQGYGVAVEYSSGDCLVDNNIFEHLRHSMLVQAGANGNVFAYNYSKDPYWIEPGYPANASGDIVCHGNYPYLNLFEGNIVQNIVVDNSHGINGPFNTFFRNRASLWGIVQVGTPVTDSVNYIGNEVTCTLPLMGNYIVAGAGTFQWGNNINNSIMPAGTEKLIEKSLFLNNAPGYWSANISYPNIGTPYTISSGINSAMLRDSLNEPEDCRKNPHFVETEVKDVQAVNAVSICPNPTNDQLTVSSAQPVQMLEVYNLSGQKIISAYYHQLNKLPLDVSKLQSGIYLLYLNNNFAGEFIKL
ncbi:MAG: glycosyl hydrolase family 28-related protein [Flavipsychrobacter sp.]